MSSPDSPGLFRYANVWGPHLSDFTVSVFLLVLLLEETDQKWKTTAIAAPEAEYIYSYAHGPARLPASPVVSLLAAVIVTVMKTVCYITIQFCHDKFPPVILKYILQGYHAQDSADYFTKKFLLEINL